MSASALGKAGLEVFLLLFALVGKKDCFRFPMNVGWCVKIRDTHVQNAISLCCQKFLIRRPSRSSVGVDNSDEQGSIRYVLRTQLKASCESYYVDCALTVNEKINKYY